MSDCAVQRGVPVFSTVARAYSRSRGASTVAGESECGQDTGQATIFRNYFAWRQHTHTLNILLLLLRLLFA